MASTERQSAKTPVTADPEVVRRRRLREDGKRPMSENLAETIALSRMLHRFAGAARRK